MLDEHVPLPGWRGGDGNDAYLDKRLRHMPMDVGLSESVGWRSILRLWFRAAVVGWVVSLFFLLLWVATGGLSSLIDAIAPSDSSFDSGEIQNSGGSGVASLGLLALALTLPALVFLIVLLLSRLDEPISEWGVLLADRAPAANPAYSQIVGQLRERGLPIRPKTRRRINRMGTVGNRLVLIDGHYQAHVTVFAYGSSLYLGWMMWRSRRGAVLIGRFVADLVLGMLGLRSPEDLMARTERPRAMREAVHAICREGLHIAVERIPVPDSYGFPQGLPPIENLPGSSAPGPVNWPPGPVAQPIPVPFQNFEQPLPPQPQPWTPPESPESPESS